MIMSYFFFLHITGKKGGDAAELMLSMLATLLSRYASGRVLPNPAADDLITESAGD